MKPEACILQVSQLQVSGLILIGIRMSAGSLPKCCAFIALSASVISPSFVKIGRWLCEKFVGQDSLSNPSVSQCHLVASSASLAASSTADFLQVAVITYKTCSTSKPGYLSDLLQDYRPARTLRSSDKLLLSLPQMALAFTAKAFSVSAPSVWNSLSYQCRSAELFSSFRRILKTELFET